MAHQHMHALYQPDTHHGYGAKSRSPPYLVTHDALTLMAHVILKNASDVIPRCKKAFEVKEQVRVEASQGTVGHAEFQIGTSR